MSLALQSHESRASGDWDSSLAIGTVVEGACLLGADIHEQGDWH